jgi:hypothetical protein
MAHTQCTHSPTAYSCLHTAHTQCTLSPIVHSRLTTAHTQCPPLPHCIRVSTRLTHSARTLPLRMGCTPLLTDGAALCVLHSHAVPLFSLCTPFRPLLSSPLTIAALMLHALLHRISVLSSPLTIAAPCVHCRCGDVRWRCGRTQACGRQQSSVRRDAACTAAGGAPSAAVTRAMRAM